MASALSDFATSGQETPSLRVLRHQADEMKLAMSRTARSNARRRTQSEPDEVSVRDESDYIMLLGDGNNLDGGVDADADGDGAGDVVADCADGSEAGASSPGLELPPSPSKSVPPSRSQSLPFNYSPEKNRARAEHAYANVQATVCFGSTLASTTIPA